MEYMTKKHFAKATPWYAVEDLEFIFQTSSPPLTPPQKNLSGVPS